jgi:hypothetical protein
MLKITALVTTIGFFVLMSVQAAAAEKTTIGNARTVVKTVTGTLDANIRHIELLDDIYHNELSR